MPRSRTVVRSILAVVVMIIAIVAWRIAPLWTGPSLPAGATRLHFATQSPNLSFGCAAALLTGVRVETSGVDIVLVAVGSGDTVRVVWPAGFGAWRVDGKAVVSDPWGAIVGREGDVLEGLGGGLGDDDSFVICPFGVPTAPSSAGPA
ncbi:MAG: hypothetical protein ABJC39_08410 [Chloroflexota bacterium]